MAQRRRRRQLPIDIGTHAPALGRVEGADIDDPHLAPTAPQVRFEPDCRRTGMNFARFSIIRSKDAADYAAPQ